MRKLLSILLICMLFVPAVLAEDSWVCSFDGHVNQKGYCPICGRSRAEAAENINACPSCGDTDNEEGSRFCANCGAPLTPADSTEESVPAETPTINPTATTTPEPTPTATPEPEDYTITVQIPSNPASDTISWISSLSRQRICLDDSGNEIYSADYYKTILSYERFSTFDDDRCLEIIDYNYSYDTGEIEPQYSYRFVNIYDDNGLHVEAFEYPCIRKDTFSGIPSRHLVFTYDDEQNNTGYVEYDTSGNITKTVLNTLNDAGNTIYSETSLPNGTVTYESTYEYDEAGNLISQHTTAYNDDGALERQYSHTYDSEGRIVSEDYHSSDGYQSKDSYTYTDGKLSIYESNYYREDESLDNSSYYSYNDREVTSVYTSYAEDGTTISYKSEEHLDSDAKTISESWFSYSDDGKLSYESNTTYSDGMRQLERTTSYGDNGDIRSLTTTTYNGDNPTFERYEFYSDDGTLSSVTDTTYNANGIKLRSTYAYYDQDGNVRSQSVTQYDENGDPVTPAPTATATPTPKPTAVVTSVPVQTAQYVYDDLPYDIKKGGGKKTDVKKLQQALIDLGYLTGSADGSFGSKTKDAVEAFQRNNGIHSVESASMGVATTFTQAVLFSSAAIPAGSSPRNVTTNATDQDISVSIANFTTTDDGSLQLFFALKNNHPTKAIIAYRIIYCAGTKNNYVTTVEGSDASSISFSDEYIAPDSMGFVSFKLDASSKEAKKISKIHFIIAEIVYEDGEVLIDYDASKSAYKLPAYALDLT